jgi:excisionase family DNA binding protein
MEILVIPKEKFEFIESSLSEIKDLLQVKQPLSKSESWISKPEACRRLNVCSKTLDSYLKKGVIPFTQYKSKIYIKSEDIDNHLEKYYVIKK